MRLAALLVRMRPAAAVATAAAVPPRSPAVARIAPRFAAGSFRPPRAFPLGVPAGRTLVAFR